MSIGSDECVLRAWEADRLGHRMRQGPDAHGPTPRKAI